MSNKSAMLDWENEPTFWINEKNIPTSYSDVIFDDQKYDWDQC